MSITNNGISASQTPLSWALRYASMGWLVHPLHSVRDGICSCRNGAECGKDAGKHPRLSNFKEHATTDSMQICKWWERWPNANIGMITGARSGIIMLDIDNQAAERWLEQQRYNYHDGPIIFTGKGRRLIFRHPNFYVKTRNRIIKKHPEIGLDVQGDKGNTVMPPSMHYLGVQYSWDLDGELGEMEEPPLIPEWLLKIIAPEQFEGEAEEAKEAKRPPPLVGWDGQPSQKGWVGRHGEEGHEGQDGQLPPGPALKHLSGCSVCGRKKEHTRYPRCWECEQKRRLDLWGETAIETELANLRKAPQGSRNEILTRISYRMGKMISHGFLSHTEAVTALESANPATDEPLKSKATIERNLKNGQRDASPSDLPPAPSAPPAPPAPSAPPAPPAPSAPPAPPAPSAPPAPPAPSAPPANLMSFELNDAGNAEAVAALYSHKFRHVEQWGWMHYNGKYWEKEGASKHLFEAVKATLRDRISRALDVSLDEDRLKKYFKVCSPETRTINAAITQLKNMPALDAKPRAFDKWPMILNTQNGTLDLKSGKLMAHNAQDMLTHCCDVSYNPRADQNIIKNFLSSLQLSEPVITYLQRAVGYSLTGSTREECLFYLHGPTRSGKGTFINLIRGLMGEPLSAEIKFDILTGSKRDDPDAQNFALAPLKACRVVAASESGRYQSMNEAKVKSLTGGDAVYCAFKNKTHFNYIPQFKIWLTSNHPPRADVDDDAIWQSRIKVIAFPTSFLGREDKQLKEYLKSTEATEAFLSWAIEGCLKWQQNSKGLEAPSEIKQETEKARYEMDEVGQWLEECANTSSEMADHWTRNDLFYQNYETWCHDNGFTPKKARSLGRSLTKKGFIAPKTPRNIPQLKKKMRGRLGFKLF